MDALRQAGGTQPRRYGHCAAPASAPCPPTRAQHLAELGAAQVELVQALLLRHISGHVALE